MTVVDTIVVLSSLQWPTNKNFQKNIVKFNCNFALELRDASLLYNEVGKMAAVGDVENAIEYLELGEKLGVVDCWTEYLISELYEATGRREWLGRINIIIATRHDDEELVEKAKLLRLNGTRKRFLGFFK